MFIEDALFTIIPLLVAVGFIIVIITIIVIIATSLKRGIKNNNSPILTDAAKVVAKRMHVQGEPSHTTYFVTFEIQLNERIEFKVSGKEYGQLAEFDIGILTYQGTRYLSFERD